MLIKYFDKFPKIAQDAFIASGCQIIGDVTIGSNASIWFNSVLRGDVASITIGDKTNIQDGTIIHVTRDGYHTIIGSEVTVGHRAILHACTLEDLSFVGMGAIIMDGVVVETGGMIAAGSLVTINKIIRKNEIWAGSPAKFFRNMTVEEQEYIKISAQNYAKHAKEYLNNKI